MHKMTWIADPPYHSYNDPNRDNNVAEITFTVAAEPSAGFDFGLTMSPSTLTAKPGEAAHFQVLVTYSDPSYSGTVINIQVTDLGPGMNWQATQTGELTITTTSTTPTGSYTIAVIGSAMGVTHKTTVSLVVSEGQPTTTGVTNTQTTITSTSVSPSATMIGGQTTASFESSTTSSVSTVTPVGSNITELIQQNPSIVLAAIVLILLVTLALRRRPSGPTPDTHPPANAVYCRKCGNQNPTTNQFCKKCGTKLS
jgi:hypothetical protein